MMHGMKKAPILARRQAADKRRTRNLKRLCPVLAAGLARQFRPVLLTGLLLLLIGTGMGCGTPSQDSHDTTTIRGSTSSSSSSTIAAISHPSGSTDVVLEVSLESGSVPIEYSLTQLPYFVLYGDGTVIEPGPTVLLFPGPALPSLQTTRLSEDALQAILSRAQRAGLLANDRDYGTPDIEDLPVTVITVNANETTYQNDIYALSAEEGATGLSPSQQEARAEVEDFLVQLAELTEFAPQGVAWSEYEFSALAAYVRASDPEDWAYSDVQPDVLEWPLSDPATMGKPIQPEGYRKIVLSGEDLNKLRPLLAQATEMTVWTYDDREYALFFRPLLPHEQTK